MNQPQQSSPVDGHAVAALARCGAMAAAGNGCSAASWGRAPDRPPAPPARAAPGRPTAPPPPPPAVPPNGIERDCRACDVATSDPSSMRRPPSVECCWSYVTLQSALCDRYTPHPDTHNTWCLLHKMASSDR